MPCGVCTVFVLTILVLPARLARANGTCSFWYTASKASTVLGLRIGHDQLSAFHNQLNIYFARATDRVTGTADLFRVPATIPMKNPTVAQYATPRCDTRICPA